MRPRKLFPASRLGCERSLLMPNNVTPFVDLADCAREPIHVPGFIQGFGVLVATRAGLDMISQISSNAEILVGQEAVQLVGQNLSNVLGTENAAEVRRVLQS